MLSIDDHYSRTFYVKNDEVHMITQKENTYKNIFVVDKDMSYQISYQTFRDIALNFVQLLPRYLIRLCYRIMIENKPLDRESRFLKRALTQKRITSTFWSGLNTNEDIVTKLKGVHTQQDEQAVFEFIKLLWFASLLKACSDEFKKPHYEDGRHIG